MMMMMMMMNGAHLTTDDLFETSLCGRDGRTLCGPQCVIVIR